MQGTDYDDYPWEEPPVRHRPDWLIVLVIAICAALTLSCCVALFVCSVIRWTKKYRVQPVKTPPVLPLGIKAAPTKPVGRREPPNVAPRSALVVDCNGAVIGTTNVLQPGWQYIPVQPPQVHYTTPVYTYPPAAAAGVTQPQPGVAQPAPPVVVAQPPPAGTYAVYTSQ